MNSEEWMISDASGRRALVPGTLVGFYRIEAPLGAGGMGQVFRAVDTRLGRPVAIKFSHEKFSDRFEREARAISALNHPNICTLYDVGENYLVMELVEGETLTARLKKGPLPIDQVLRFGAQIADALTAAHDKGITHRDLKPGNIMLTKAGVKVLDFGLARIEHDETLTLSNMVLGTPAYMAPEQREGKEADARADIYALGLVLREMAMGKRGLELTNAPTQVAHIVARCLEADPADRWQSARDVQAELAWSAAAPAAPTAANGVSVWMWAAIACGLAMMAALLWAWSRPHAPSPERSYRLEVIPAAGSIAVPASGIAISPDGKTIVYVGQSAGGNRLWIRPLNSSATRDLPGTEGAIFPFWSPDSKSVGFFASAKLKRVDAAGGPPTDICSVSSGRGGTWNSDGIILFNGVNDGPILQVPASGGTPTAVTTVDTAHGEDSHRWPQFLPDGRSFLYFVRTLKNPADAVFLSNLDRPQEKTRVVTSTADAVYAPGSGKDSGILLWLRGTDLVSTPFDPAHVSTPGEAVVVADGMAEMTQGSRYIPVSASRDGTILYTAGTAERSQITWYGRDGRMTGMVAQPDTYRYLRISPDGKRVVAVSMGGIWSIEFARGIPTRLNPGYDNPVWSPDGQQIAYDGNVAPPNLFLMSANGAGPGVRLTESRNSESLWDWSSDGRYLLYSSQSNDLSSTAPNDLWLLPMTGERKPVRYLETPAAETSGAFSPDSKWIAYSSNASGRREVYVQGLPAGDARWQVSSKGGDQARWRRDGKELFYVAPDGTLMSVEVRTAGGLLEFKPPVALFKLTAISGGAFAYDVAMDGKSFLALAPGAETRPPSLTVMLHWEAELPH